MLVLQFFSFSFVVAKKKRKRNEKFFIKSLQKFSKNIIFIFHSFFGIQILEFLCELACSIKHEYFNKVHISKPKIYSAKC